MKKNISAMAVLFCTAFLLQSCAVNKNSVDSQNVSTENAGESAKNCFVQLNDGTIKQYSSLKMVTGILTTPYLVADNNVTINANDIMAYQDKKQYAVSAKILTSNKKSRVAADALPGFAVKVISGKLNVYSRKYYNGANTVNEYFLQQGPDGFIVAYSKSVLKNMLKEDKKALEYFNSKTKNSFKSIKLLTAVEMYNNNNFLTRN